RLCLLALAAWSAAALSAAADDKDGLTKPPPGFVALFNGKDVTGWHGVVPFNDRIKMSTEQLQEAQKAIDDKVLPHWKAEHGVLVNDGEGDNLATVKEYGNIELMIDWKIEPKGDSGIYLRGHPQVQIWDSDALDPKKYPKEYAKGSGALWNNRKPEEKVPLKRAYRAPGEWNTFHIGMKGDKGTVKLNGE